MNLSGTKLMSILRSDLFFYDEVVEDALQILEVGHVAARPNDCEIADRVKTLDVLEASERTI